MRVAGSLFSYEVLFLKTSDMHAYIGYQFSPSKYLICVRLDKPTFAFGAPAPAKKVTAEVQPESKKLNDVAQGIHHIILLFDVSL